MLEHPAAAGPRTVSLVTREMIAGNTLGILSARVTLLEAGGGFCGFLLGAGTNLDPLAAVVVQGASGEGGGFFAVVEADGTPGFREHTDETAPVRFAALPSSPVASKTTAMNWQVGEELRMSLTITPRGVGRFDLALSVEGARGRTMSVVRRDVPEAELRGGIALVSSATAGGGEGPGGARFAFSDVQSGGEKIVARPERALGPIVGALYSLNTAAGANRAILKLSAQFAPLFARNGATGEACLQYRAANETAWRNGPAAPLAIGCTAQFRVENWDATRAWNYRVVYGTGAGAATYEGTIAADPGDARPLVIGLVSCVIATVRALDAGAADAGGHRSTYPGAKTLGRFTPAAVYFPHRELASNIASHQPDLLVFSGDQFYEQSPTRQDKSDFPVMDYLYKWSLWVLSFRDLSR